MNLSIEELVVIKECLESIWDCYNDRPTYNENGEKEKIRLNLIKKMDSQLNKDGDEVYVVESTDGPMAPVLDSIHHSLEGAILEAQKLYEVSKKNFKEVNPTDFEKKFNGSEYVWKHHDDFIYVSKKKVFK